MKSASSCLLTAILASAPLLASLPMTAAHAAPSCNGVVKVNNDFYLATQAGNVISRFTSDGQPKGGAVISPDGSRIAFMLDADNEIVEVADAHGGVGKYTLGTLDDGTSSATQMILSMRWASNSWLQVVRHASPSMSRFDHYGIPSTLVAGPTALQPARAAMPAVYCSIARITDYPACVLGSTATVSGIQIYNKNGYDGTMPIQSLVIPVGGTATIGGELPISIKVISVQGGITLSVIYPDTTSTGRIPFGATMPVVWDDTLYGLAAKVATGGVQIDVLKSTLDGIQVGLEPVIAWRGSDGQVLVVERTASGKRLDVVEPVTLNPPTWKMSASTALPIDEPLHEFRFIDPTTALFRTNHEFLLLPVNITNSNGKTSISIGDISPLPDGASVVLAPGAQPVIAQFIDWACVVN